MDIQTPPFLELHNAVVQRAGAPILTVDSFRLEEGEHLALLGPNGDVYKRQPTCCSSPRRARCTA